MSKIIVTGSAGLIGSETVKHLPRKGMRGRNRQRHAQPFFGAEASTRKTRDELVETVADYEHHDLDIRDAESGA